jgi:hypothetical protein
MFSDRHLGTTPYDLTAIRGAFVSWQANTLYCAANGWLVFHDRVAPDLDHAKVTKTPESPKAHIKRRFALIAQMACPSDTATGTIVPATRQPVSTAQRGLLS